jgi:hypothetical protein
VPDLRQAHNTERAQSAEEVLSQILPRGGQPTYQSGEARKQDGTGARRRRVRGRGETKRKDAMSRYAKKVDSVHGEIRDALRKVTRVLDTSGLGFGMCDLLAYHVSGRVVFIEVKSVDGKRKKRVRKLTKAQEKLRMWLNYTVVTSVSEAYEACGFTVRRQP